MPPNIIPSADAPAIHYPESDGKPTSDNTKQGRWITLLYENLEALFAGDPNVFVAPNNMWYPVEGQPTVCAAPDVSVVFGRPKGDRGSYQQWREGDVPLTVVFEVLSPENDVFEMADKLAFYDDHGVEEYYVYDPDSNKLLIYRQQGTVLRKQVPPSGFVSPRLGIRFDLSAEELVVRYPDGRPFVRLLDERRRADNAEQRLARVIELGRKARRGEASADELAELDRLETATP